MNRLSRFKLFVISAFVLTAAVLFCLYFFFDISILSAVGVYIFFAIIYVVTFLILSKNVKEDSQLESLIIAMVSTEQFKYNFEEVKKLTIYQFNESVRQIIKKVEYDNRMHGIYSGTINAKDLNKDDLNWLTHK